MEMQLVKYLKDGDKLIGAVVGLPDGKIGVSICNETDTFNKQRAVGLAGQRARYDVDTKVPHRWIKHSKASYLFLPEVVTSEVAIMAERLKRYYKLQSVPKKTNMAARLVLALATFGF